MKKFVDEEKLLKLCKITKLEIAENEIDKYLDMINSNLETLDKLDNVDTSGLEPLINPYQMILQEYPDVVSDGNKVNEVMSTAPKSLYNYFIVPKVIEK
ncbi:MAG: Asp-tRNA(Asn)/Glu-tRNA(Gln) amidotransferase subunit GatC [Rickettsiales bacterium]|jgi:aspartyl-tRNA(Asn)/glutamyl-tRNA(Gln) amidotransferase subunit C|nr:Asp-tRNA(Asn)/Glu-tRNA(Gln) amidotransferase subunit GatC [Rickettsiales bacterium]